MTSLVSNMASIAVGQAAVQGPVQPGAAPLPGATSGLFGSGGKFDFMTALSTGMSFASAASTMFGSNAQADAQMETARRQADALALSAREESIEASREMVRGKQEANDLMDQLRRTIATQQLASATQGVDIGFGTPQSVSEAARKTANLQLSVSRSDAQIRALARRRQADAFRQDRAATLISAKKTAANTRKTGFNAAMGTLSELQQRRSERG